MEDDGSYYVYLRGKGNTAFGNGSSLTMLGLTGDATSVECNGNIMTLLDYENPDDAVMADYCFAELFFSCSKLSKAPDLPATNLSNYCYLGMFYCCTKLVNAPVLPATTMAVKCYYGIFYGCSSIVTPPELPAKNLAEGCYNSMFDGCSSLKTAPSLPATKLAESCYESMFEKCSSLESAPVLSSTELAKNCYDGMFKGCSSLKAAPVLPAKTLAESCYEYMFYGCSSIEETPVLESTSLATKCYQHMFEGCSSLKSTPELPATLLKDNCYYGMFKNCANLTSISKIANGTQIDIPTKAMEEMFQDCPGIRVEHTDDSDPDRFISIGNFVGEYAVYLMFYNNVTEGNFGSYNSPLANNSFKLSKPYVTFKADDSFALGCLADGLAQPKSWDGTIEYSTDLKTWTAWNGTTPIDAVKSSGSYYIYLRGKNTSLHDDSSNYTNFTLTGSATSVECDGSIMNLIDYEHPDTVALAEYCFQNLFAGCSKLSKAPNLYPKELSEGCYKEMFSNCTSLTTAPELIATEVKEACYSGMFKGCTALEASPALPAEMLNWGDCYNSMFMGCTNLTSIGKISATQVSGGNSMANMFNGCSKIKVAETDESDTESFIQIWMMIESAVQGMFGNCVYGTVITPSAGKYYKLVEPIPDPISYNLNWNATKLDPAGINQTLYKLATTSTKIEFGKTENYQTIVEDTVNYAKYDVGETDADLVYAYYKSTTPSELYILSDGEIAFAQNDMIDFDIGDDIITVGPFAMCSETKSIVLKNVNTNALTNLNNCFAMSSELTTIDVSGLDTKNVTNMYGMFAGCENLASVDLSMLNTENLENMAGMFNGDTKLETVVFGNFKTIKVTTMDGLFEGCESLKNVDFSKFETPNVTNMSSVFNGCKSLTVIDISSFEFDSVTNMHWMFGSVELTTIYVKEGTDLSTSTKLSSTDTIFNGCNNLVGQNGTAFKDISNGSMTYARVDAEGTKGYFSVK